MRIAIIQYLSWPLLIIISYFITRFVALRVLEKNDKKAQEAPPVTSSASEKSNSAE